MCGHRTAVVAPAHPAGPSAEEPRSPWPPAASCSVNRHSGKVLDVVGVSTSDGADVTQWS